MLIDDEEKFDTDKDELKWTKIIIVNPLPINNSKSVHIVKYYKTISNEEYYIFDYITADNNGLVVDKFDGFHWREIINQIDFSDYCFIYSRDKNNKDCFRFVTSGDIIKKYIHKYTEGHTKIYELRHH